MESDEVDELRDVCCTSCCDGVACSCTDDVAGDVCCVDVYV